MKETWRKREREKEREGERETHLQPKAVSTQVDGWPAVARRLRGEMELVSERFEIAFLVHGLLRAG